VPSAARTLSKKGLDSPARFCYNCSMKTLSFTVAKTQHPNPRVHNLLFSSNSPFKPKKVLKKTAFRRQIKHKNQQNFG
jgi:hypothetical protein